ncbi:hypothetical protein [Streptomyces sp. OR43]|nr:hypothetical protein [Streptomyces sp. or43]
MNQTRPTARSGGVVGLTAVLAALVPVRKSTEPGPAAAEPAVAAAKV